MRTVLGTPRTQRKRVTPSHRGSSLPVSHVLVLELCLRKQSVLPLLLLVLSGQLRLTYANPMRWHKGCHRDWNKKTTLTAAATERRADQSCVVRTVWSAAGCLPPGVGVFSELEDCVLGGRSRHQARYRGDLTDAQRRGIPLLGPLVVSAISLFPHRGRARKPGPLPATSTVSL